MNKFRRRVITLLACTAALPVVPGFLASGRQAGRYRTDWRGSALGADARMQVVHGDPEASARLIRRCLAEVERLENIFSLYRDGSELSMLNQNGRLDNASQDMRFVLKQALRFGALTEGRFDVTVQPLWRLHTARGVHPSPESLAATLRLIDYRNVDLDGGAVRLANPGMAVTLNGIAQGYISDRIAGLCRDSGFDRVLVQMGETVAVNPAQGGRPWRIGLAAAPDAPGLSLTNQAIASSGRGANRPGFTHIYDPLSGRPVEPDVGMHVVAPDALTADAVSTALSVLPPSAAQTVIERLGGVTAYLVRKGAVTTLTANPTTGS